MFLRLNEHDYVKVGFFDNIGGETNVERLTHRFAQNSLGHAINSTICIDEQELRNNRRHCPICSKYIDLKSKAKNREDHKQADKYKPEPFYTSIIYNYTDKKVQIMQYSVSIYEELERIRRQNGTLTDYMVGIKNNHGFNNEDKKWYKVQRLEKTDPLDKIVITPEITKYFEQVTTPEDFDQIDAKMRGEIKIVEGTPEDVI